LPIIARFRLLRQHRLQGCCFSATFALRQISQINRSRFVDFFLGAEPADKNRLTNPLTVRLCYPGSTPEHDRRGWTTAAFTICGRVI